MSEAHYRKEVVIPGLKKLGADPIAVENGRCHPGTPDVNWTHGWIELKVNPAWPARASTLVKFETFTKQQRIWLRNRWNAGGSAYLLARVGRNHLLWTGSDAADFVGIVDREKLEALAVMNTVGFDAKLLLQHLLLRKADR